MLDTTTIQPLGYEWLRRKYQVQARPHYSRSFLRGSGGRRTVVEDGLRTEYYPPQYDPGAKPGDQIEFALKHEGVDLQVLRATFEATDPAELAGYISARPTSIYTRRIWFFYEWLTGSRLPLPDTKNVRYVPALDPLRYFGAPSVRSRRHLVENNLPGTPEFCPLIRRTKQLQTWTAANLQQKARELVQAYESALIARAIDYLYTKETKSSYEIEREVANGTRQTRFVALLRLAHQQLFNSKQTLLELQNAIVDPRFAAADYRGDQSYVGEATLRGERVHYVCPKPEDVPTLMRGLLALWQRVGESNLHPVLAAALVSFGFVFIHPFDDGNGRIHRFLIHNILAKSGFSPGGIIFPVSASMLRQLAEYDRVLERISMPLNALVEYTMDSEGRMTVHGETVQHYRYPDFTHIAEQLFAFVQDTIETDLVEELQMLTAVDSAKGAVQDIVDMPDSLIYLFIRLVHQNGGRLSEAKRKSRFAQLNDSEIERMEAAVRDAFDAST